MARSKIQKLLYDGNFLSPFSSAGKLNLDSTNSISLGSRIYMGIPRALLAWGLMGLQSGKDSSLVNDGPNSLLEYKLLIPLHPFQLFHLLPGVCCSFLVLLGTNHKEEQPERPPQLC